MPKLYYRIILIVLTVACGMVAVVTTPFATRARPRSSKFGT